MYRTMHEHTFRDEIWLPRPRTEVFPFFADARNLGVITPPWVRFETLTPTPIDMRPGALIDYRIRLRGFPMRWRTEIETWEPPFRFTDRQLRGPYRLWHHTHTFEERDGGTLCRDEVRYAVWGGALVESFFVRGDIRRIFAFRREKLTELFSR